MITLSVFAYLIALFALGWLILGFVPQTEIGTTERAGLAYPLGAGIFTWTFFLATGIGLPVTLATAGLTYGILLILCLWFLRRRNSHLIPVSTHCLNLNTVQIILVGIIGILIFTAFTAAIYMPLHAWDSLAIWGLKAKLIAATGKIAPQAQAAWPFYPLNIPLQMTFLFLLDENFLQIIFPIYFLSLILLFHANLRQWTGRTLALACVLFLSTTPIMLYQATIAYANLPFAFYYMGSVIYLYRYLKEHKAVWLVVSSVLIGVASWTRAESLLYLAINAIILLLFEKQKRMSLKRTLAYVCIFAVFWMPWVIYSKLAGYSDYVGNAAISSLMSIISGNLATPLLGQILGYAGSRVFTTNTWGVLWIGLLVALVIGINHWRKHAPLLLLLALNFVGLVFTYYSASVTSPNSIEWWLHTGFDRMALHWAPLAVFYLGLTIEANRFSRINMFSFLKRTDPYLILLFLFSLFAIGPLLAPGYFWGAHDGRHSVYFLFEFDRSIQDGIFYPRWAPDYTFGYGYPMFNIYAPGALYVSEFFHLIGLDFVLATKMTFALAILLSGPAMFGFIKRLTGSSPAAFLSGLAYVYVPYHIADIYVRAALAESVALIFLPLTLWGFYETVVNPSRTAIVATAMAYAAMMFSHNGVTLLFTIVLGAWVLFLMVNEIRRVNLPSAFVLRLSSFIRLGLPSLAALLLGLGIVAIFFIPAVLEYRYVRTDQWLGNYYDYTHHFVYLFQLFSPTWGFGISNPGPRDDMSFQFGSVPTLLAIFSLLAITKNPNGTRRFWLFFLAMTAIVAVLMLGGSLPIWQVLPIVTFAQFPWRLLVLTTVSLAVLASAIIVTQIHAETRNHTFPTILLGILIVLGSFPYLQAQMILEPKEGPVSILGLFRFQQSAGEMTGSTAWVKEIPTWSPMADVYFAGKKLKSRIEYGNLTDLIEQDKLWIGVLPNFAGLKANSERIVYHAEQATTLLFNIFYYPGWQAYLVKPQTTEIIRPLKTFVDPDDPLGRIRVEIPAGREQWLMLRFDDTPPRIVGTWISVASILIAFGLLIWDVRKSGVGVQGSETER